MIARAQNDLKATLVNNPVRVAELISGFQGQMADSPNLGRQEQYQNIVRSITDSRGIIQAAALMMGIPEDLQLKTSETSPVGRAIRQTINESLGILVQGALGTDIAPALPMLFTADSAFATEDKILGNRLLNRARIMLDYATNNPRVESYNSVNMTPAAAERFGSLSTNNTYRSYQYTRISNALAEIPESSFSNDLYILASVAVKQVAKYAEDRGYEQEFHRALDIAYSVYDFKMGFYRGVANGVVNTASGLLQIVRHPVDSAVSIAKAMWYLEEVVETAVDKSWQIITQFPNYTPERQGEVAGRIAFEIASFLITRGLGKPGTSAADLAQSESLVVLSEEFAGVANSAKEIGATTSETMQDFAKWLKKPLAPNPERGAIGNSVDKTLEIIKDLRQEKTTLEGGKLFEQIFAAISLL